MQVGPWRVAALLPLILGAGGLIQQAVAQDDSLPRYLRDRGGGVATSMFGTYINRGQLLLFPFFAYSRDDNREYQPAQLGFGLGEDFRGKFHSSEGQILVAYGVTDRLALEFEAAYITATLEKSPSDASAMPARIRQSGLADFEGQIRLTLMTERRRRPEIFSFLEMTPRSQRHKALIGEPYWDLKPGLGLVRGFSFGTLTLRLTGEWNHEAGNADLGEVAVEYLKRLSPGLRLNIAVEGGEGGAPDEFELISGVNWRIADRISLKLDNSLGISSKATDWAPQIGLMFSFPK